jgi:excisionase family DNA binding protein
MTPSVSDHLIGVDELARALGISRHTVYSWVAQRRIPFLKVGRLLRFDVRLIDAWLEEQAHIPAAVEGDTRPALDRTRCGTRPERRS